MIARVGVVMPAALLPGAASASAQGVVFNRFNRPGSGARAAGMANAFIAVSDDGRAASWNPAGLGQLRKPELSIVTTTSGQSVRAQGFRTRDDLSVFTTARSFYRNTYPDFASLAVPVTLWGKPVTFQGSWRRLYPLEYREVFSMERRPLAAQGPPPASIEANNDLLGAVDLVSIAGAVKLPPTRWTDFENHTSLGASGEPAPPPLSIRGRARFPRALGLGGAWHPAPPWTVALDLTRDYWRDAILDTATTRTASSSTSRSSSGGRDSGTGPASASSSPTRPCPRRWGSAPPGNGGSRCR